MHIKSTNISISSVDNKGQLRTSSLTNNNSSKNNTEALCCVEICELAQCETMCLVTDRISTGTAEKAFRLK